jgi:hypothetical protein
MIASCPYCRLIFEDNAMTIRNATSITLTNITITCPNCQRDAKYLDGTFNFDAKGVLTVLSAPIFTNEILRRIQALVDRVGRDNLSETEFHKEISKMHPMVSKLLNLFVPKEASGFYAMIAVLLFLLNQILNTSNGEKEVHHHKDTIQAIDTEQTIIQNGSTNIYSPAEIKIDTTKIKKK